MIRRPPQSGSTARAIDEQQVIGVLQRNIAQVAQMLRKHFPPWSLFQPPATGVNANGNRSVALTANAPVADTALLAMVNGRVKWTFSREFATPPICTASALKAYPGGAAQEIFVAVEPTTTSVVFQSSANDDVRILHMHATLTPE